MSTLFIMEPKNPPVRLLAAFLTAFFAEFMRKLPRFDRKLFSVSYAPGYMRFGQNANEMSKVCNGSIVSMYFYSLELNFEMKSFSVDAIIQTSSPMPRLLQQP